MKKAFTLIELIATIVILGVVTSVVSILIMNVIRNAKDSANKRSIDNYGRIVETSMAEYQSQYLKYPDSIEQLEIEYVGSVIECETRRINPDKTIYLSECKVNGKKVLDKNTEDGYYHYGTLLLTNEEYVDKLGKNIEVALKDYYEENNNYPVNYRLLNLPTLDKDVNCVSKIHPDGTVYLTKCSIDGSYIMNENEEDGYYHYGNGYDYIDKDGNWYVEVEYLESTGTQYIDTGFMPNQDTSVITKINFRELTSDNASVFGARIGVYYSHYGITIGSGTQNLFYYGYNNMSQEIGKKAIINTDYKLNKMKNLLYVDDNLIYSGSYGYFNVPVSMYIFGMNQNDEAIFKSKIMLYYMEVYDNDTLVRDYIPVLNSSNRPCLFDKVERKCYYNQGTGEFLYG